MGNQSRKLILIGAGVFVFLIFGIIVALNSGGEKPTDNGLPPGAKVTIDKDTGDEIVTVPGKDKEQFLSDEPMILGGDDLLYKTPLTNDQYDGVIMILTNYSKEKIGKVSTIKFLPDSIKEASANDRGDYNVQVKTVGPENILNVSINMLGLDRVQLFITNVTQPNLGTFESEIAPPPQLETVEGDVGTD